MKNKIVGLVIFCSVFHPGINCQEFVQVLKDVGPDRTENKHFGNEVDMFGNYAVVGSFQANTDLGGDDSIGFTGAAYMRRLEFRSETHGFGS